MASENHAVSLDAVTKYYGEQLAVDDVSLDVDQGEFVTLLGPSGCGKSTILRMVCGFIEPTHGEIRLEGRSVLGLPPYRRNTSMVFQDYALFPHRTVAQNLAFGLRMKKVARDEIERQVDAMLELLSLPGMGSRRIREISGGQQQRVALGRALIVEPAVLLLDEPLGALDFKLRKQMQGELKRIQRRVGITFIYVTHDQEEALTMSDRIAVMNAGKVEQFGTPQEVYQHPASAFVADFVGEANLFSCQVVAVDGDQIKVALDSGDEFTVSSYDGQERRPGDQITVIIRPENIELVTEPGPEFNGVRGKINEVVYAGATIKIRALTDSGATLNVSLRSSDRIPIGSPSVGFAWSAGRASVV